MNFKINFNQPQTAFKGFKVKPFGASYLKNTCSSQDIADLNKSADYIKNTKYYDLEVGEDGFAIIDKKNKKSYKGNLGIETFGMYGEGGTWLVNNDGKNFKEKALININEMTQDDWRTAKSVCPNKTTRMSTPIKYVFYTMVLEANKANKEIKLEKERTLAKQNEQKAQEEKIMETTKKDKAIDDLLQKFGE